MQDTVTISIDRFKELEQKEKENTALKKQVKENTAFLQISLWKKTYSIFSKEDKPEIKVVLTNDTAKVITDFVDKEVRPELDSLIRQANAGIDDRIEGLEFNNKRYLDKIKNLESRLDKIPNWVKRIFKAI